MLEVVLRKASFYNLGIFLQKKVNISILEQMLFWILNIIEL